MLRLIKINWNLSNGRMIFWIFITSIVIFIMFNFFESAFRVAPFIFGLFLYLSDEEAKEKVQWESYLLTLPISTKVIIIERYIRIAAYNIIGLLIGAVVIVFDMSQNGGSFIVNVNWWYIFGFTFGIGTIIIPLTIKFGLRGGSVAGMLSLLMGDIISTLYAESIKAYDWTLLAGPIVKIVMLLVVVIAAYGISFKISKGHYKDSMEYLD